MIILDDLLVNLKIISKIPENGRLKLSKNGNVEIQEKHNLQFIQRYINGDSRKKTIENISYIVDSSIDKCNDILNSKYLENNNHSNYVKYNDILNVFHDTFKKCIFGLHNLKITYNTDVTSISKIDILIFKIQIFIKSLDDYFKK